MKNELLTQVPARLEAALRTVEQLQTVLSQEIESGLETRSSSSDRVRMAAQLADAATKLGRETRAWVVRVRELGTTASLEEKLYAVERFILELNPEVRTALMARLVGELGVPAKRRGRPPGSKNKTSKAPRADIARKASSQEVIP